MTDNYIINKILEEYGLINSDGETNVTFLGFDELKDRWVIRYKNGLPDDEFEIFDDLIDYLKQQDYD